MRLHIQFPMFTAKILESPTKCPQSNCNGTSFYKHGKVIKISRGVISSPIKIQRYRCTTCWSTFRHYYDGMNQSSISQYLLNVGCFIYNTGLSYRETAEILRGEFYITPGVLYRSVQQIRDKIPRYRIFTKIRSTTGGVDVWFLPGQQWLSITVYCDTHFYISIGVEGLEPTIITDLKLQIDFLASMMNAVSSLKN